jgi:hypothetical protein
LLLLPLHPALRTLSLPPPCWPVGLSACHVAVSRVAQFGLGEDDSLTALLSLSLSLSQFGLGEDATLSAPATVDLAALFNTTLTAFKIKTVEEVSLTNNQPKALIMQKRAQALQWSGNGTGGESAKTHAWRSAAPLDWAAGTSVTLGPLEIKTFVLHA